MARPTTRLCMLMKTVEVRVRCLRPRVRAIRFEKITQHDSLGHPSSTLPFSGDGLENHLWIPLLLGVLFLTMISVYLFTQGNNVGRILGAYSFHSSSTPPPPTSKRLANTQNHRWTSPPACPPSPRPALKKNTIHRTRPRTEPFAECYVQYGRD